MNAEEQLRDLIQENPEVVAEMTDMERKVLNRLGIRGEA